jgi:hypothetical protein
MPDNITFFTAVQYGQEAKTFRQSLLEKIDNYFYLGGKKAHVIPGRTKSGHEKIVLAETNSSLLARIGKVLSYFTVILPLAMLITKAVLRKTHTFRVIDPKKKLEKGIDISEETISKIEKLIPSILSRKRDEGIEWLSIGNNLVFKLKSNPELVFKITSPKYTNGNEYINERFENMIKAKEVCLIHQLGLLKLPHAKKVTVTVNNNAYDFIAEESLNITNSYSLQENFYHTYSKELNETIHQLSIFVAITGFNDVKWGNIPVLNETPEHKGPRRVGLIDVEHMKNAVTGFKGDGYNESRGLIRCATSEEQIDIIIAEARKQGVPLTSKEAQDVKQQRLDELKADKELQALYEKNGIVTGKEPIQVDLDSLNLDLTEESKISVWKLIEGTEDEFKHTKETITLKKAAEDIIEEINKLIQKSPDIASPKRKRCFILDTNSDPFKAYNNTSLSSGKSSIPKEEAKQPWLPRIIQALIKKGYLFKLDQVDHQGYHVQA